MCTSNLSQKTGYMLKKRKPVLVVGDGETELPNAKSKIIKRKETNTTQYHIPKLRKNELDLK